MTIRKGEPWGAPTTAPPDLEVSGDDTALAALLPAHQGALVRFRPTHSDLAKAVGLAGDATPAGVALPIDAMSRRPART